MSDKDYGLEISAKAAEMSNELLRIMQQVPKEHTEKIIQIGNEIRDIVTAARKEIEPQKFYYVVFSGEDHYPETEDGRYYYCKNAEKKVEELKKDDWTNAEYVEVLFDDFDKE